MDDPVAVTQAVLPQQSSVIRYLAFVALFLTRCSGRKSNQNLFSGKKI